MFELYAVPVLPRGWHNRVGGAKCAGFVYKFLDVPHVVTLNVAMPYPNSKMGRPDDIARWTGEIGDMSPALWNQGLPLDEIRPSL